MHHKMQNSHLPFEKISAVSVLQHTMDIPQTAICHLSAVSVMKHTMQNVQIFIC